MYLSEIVELIPVQETAVTKRLLQLEQGVAELKMGGDGGRGVDASQHYLGFMEVKLVLQFTSSMNPCQFMLVPYSYLSSWL